MDESGTDKRVGTAIQAHHPALRERVVAATVFTTGMLLVVPLNKRLKLATEFAWSLSMTTGYHSTKDLIQRFRCSSRTIFRRMRRPENPFPAPCMRHAGSFNLWDADEVAKWEERERERSLLAA